MWLWRQIKAGLRSLLQREDADRDLAEEVAQYLEEAEAELVASGASPEGARRAVRLRYGDGLSAREDVRAYGWENTVEALFADLRFAARRLRQSPRFTMVAVLTLGLGIGSSTAIFSAVHPVLFKPLAYANADRIFAVADRLDDGSPLQLTFGSYRELSERSRAFEALSVFKPWQPTMTGGEEPERLDGQRVTAGYFSILGVAPAFGPGFEASADRPGGPNVVVLSDALWRRSFASDRTVLGRQVTLDDEPYVVVGVMPPTFENVTAPLAQAWALLQYDSALPTFDGREWGHHVDMIGRLREGAESEGALRDLNGIADRPVEEFVRPDWADMELGLSLRPLREATTAGARPTMLALAGAVGLLLAIACVNVTILLLGRGAQRQGELAMRVALGAGRGHLVRQLLTESLLLAGLGGAVGILVAQLGIAALVAISPPGLPRVSAIAIDGAALAFALGVTTLIGVLVGLIPALAPSMGELRQAMRKAGRTSAVRHRSAQRALVVTEVALALMLLVGAGLLLRSMQRLFAIPPGFDPSQVVVMQVRTAGFEDGNATHRFFDQALDAVQQLPGVASAALTSQLPLSGENDAYGFTLEEDAGEGIDGAAHRHAVSPDYFETMEIPLLRGRRLGKEDITGAMPVVVVSEALARRSFPGREAIGQRMHVGRTDLPWYTVAGVVGDVKQLSLEADQAEAVYFTPEQWYFADRVRWFVVRADVDAAALIPAIRRAIWSVDSDQLIARIQSMEDLVARSEAKRRFVLIVLEAFALLALTLAGIGLYGVLSGNVTERMREIGVRAALGASPESILALVVRQGMTLTAVGVTIGLAGAVAASEALVALLYDVSRLDAVTYLSVVTLLAVVSAVACWIPAARATRVDPLNTLRAE